MIIYFINDYTDSLQTGCSITEMAKLAFHGNFCGIGSRGDFPQDDVDQCCQTHDNCFGEAEIESGCKHGALES